MCGALESITSSHSHTIEVETTLDHRVDNDALINDAEYEDTVGEIPDVDWNDEDEYDEIALGKQFPLEYMTRAVNFNDGINL